MSKNFKLFNNWLLKLFSLVFAIVLWVVIININDPKITKIFTNVPVTVINQESIKSSGKVFEILENSNTVNITVYGRRSIVEKMTNNSFQPTADLKELTFMNTIRIEPNIQVPGIELSNLTCNPANMKISIEDEALKRFVVNIDTGGTKPESGFEVGEANSSTDSLTISGPKSIINKLDKVVAKIDITGMKENGRVPATFKVYDRNGEEIDPITYNTLIFHNIGKDRTIDVDIHLLKIKKVPISVVTHKQPALGYEVVGHKATPERISIVGEEDILDQIDVLQVELDGDISSYRKDVSTTIDIKNFLPPGVRLASEESDKVIVDTQIALMDAWNIEVPVVSIKAENLAKNLQITYPNEERLLIPVRRLNDIESFPQAKDIEVSIDFNNFKEGTYELPVKVKLPNGFTLERDDISVSVTINSKE